MSLGIARMLFEKHKKLAKQYVVTQAAQHLLPIVTSVDIRDAGFKIAPVDTNLFPAGFNNLTLEGFKQLKSKISLYINAYFPKAKKIAIFPENFTRNIKYLESLAMLCNALDEVGFEVYAASSLIAQEMKLEQLTIHTFESLAKRGWHADLILLNNDLTDRVPQYLLDTKVPVVPSFKFGWHSRRKHIHFECYHKLMTEFCMLAAIDPWIFSTEFTSCQNIDFKSKVGLECVAGQTEVLLGKIREKYLQHGVKSEPAVFIKPNQGTYGMGVMVARSGEDVINISKKKRHSMKALKHGVDNHEVMIQEGVPTIEDYQGASAETMAYLCGGQVLELFMRSHEERDTLSNLNTRGMMFSRHPQPFDELHIFIAQMAAVATCLEQIP